MNPESIPHRWTAAWSSPTHDPTAWLALYHPSATYIDHAFQIRRTGLTFLRRHFEIWHHAMADFTMTVERVDAPTTRNAAAGGERVQLPDGWHRQSIRTVNRGKFVNDLPGKKASGREFCFSAVVDFVVDAEGKVREVQEWYTEGFDRSTAKGVEGYHTLPRVKL